MIHIDDILERKRRNPEPKEVTEIRELIKNSFNKLEFVEEGHKYYLPKNDGSKEELISVSAMTKMFEKELDWDLIAETYSFAHDIPVDKVKRMWKENNLSATSNGSKVHMWGECMMRLYNGEEDFVKENIPFLYQEGFMIPSCPKEQAIEKYYLDILNNDDVYPIMPETKVYTGMNDKYNFNLNYAGTFDILLAMRINGQIKIAIHDFKTNASLYKPYNRNNDIRLLKNFNDLIDEPLSHYYIQLNAYQIALSQLDLPIVDRRLIWLKDDATYEKISVPCMTDRLIDFLQTYNNME